MWVKSQVRIHVKDGTIENKITAKMGYLIPRVACEEAGISDGERFISGGGIDGGEGARGCRGARGILCSKKVEGSAMRELSCITLKIGSDILSWRFSEREKINGVG